VDIPIGSRGYEPQRDCPRGDCIVAQISREERILADGRLLVAVRAEALRFLIHFVADVHQPLHASDNHDRGGNEVRIAVAGKRTNLHALWDTDLVRGLGTDPNRIAADLLTRITPRQQSEWSSGDATTWANESFNIASSEIYSGLPGFGPTARAIVQPESYPSSERGVIAVQLEKAGVRLAWVLNAVLGEPS
jgi:hypothetical protein